MKIEKSVLEFWRSELDYLRDCAGEEETNEIWMDRFKRLIERVEELELEVRELEDTEKGPR